MQTQTLDPDALRTFCAARWRDSIVPALEEFIVINTATDVATTERAAERLREAVARLTIDHGTYRGGVTLSLGIAQMLPGMDGTDELIKAADEALYAAKAKGRNRTCVAGRSDDGPHGAGGEGRSIA